MRNPWQGDDARRARRRRTARPGSPLGGSSPYDFGSLEDDDNVDPVDVMAIWADEELLDALGSGAGVGDGFGARLGAEPDPPLDDGYHDEQKMLALLQAWRADVTADPIPELLTAEQASEAIVAGHRGNHLRRRLMSVAAAAVVVVFGLSAVALGAGGAKPGDPLWGVSTVLDSERAQSVEAAQRVDVALASAQQALAEGRVADAQVALASAAPELSKVTDEETKQELERKSANLTETAGATDEGKPVKTDESGKPISTDPKAPQPGQPGSGGAGSSSSKGESADRDAGPGSSSNRPNPGSAGSDPRKPAESTKPESSPELRQSPKSPPAPPKSTAQPQPAPKPDVKPKPPAAPEPKPDQGGEGEGSADPPSSDDEKSSPPAQGGPPGPQEPQPSS